MHEKEEERRYCSDWFKPTVLENGRLLAMGYRFYRTDPDQTIVNPDSDGLRDGDNLISFSDDEGRTWSQPEILPRTRAELIEQSGPAIQLRSGVLLGAGSLFPMWDGSNPGGTVGALLRSEDDGKTWDDRTNFFEDLSSRYALSEPRLCEMPDGRLISLNWMMDHVAGTNTANHITISHDGGAHLVGPHRYGDLGPGLQPHPLGRQPGPECPLSA